MAGNKICYLFFCLVFITSCFKNKDKLSAQRETYLAKNNDQVILRIKTEVAPELKVEFRSLEQAVSLKKGRREKLAFQLTNKTNEVEKVVVKMRVFPASTGRWLVFEKNMEKVSLSLDPNQSLMYETTVLLQPAIKGDIDFVNLDLTLVDGDAISVY